MANTIKLKRGSGSDPSASDLAVGEVAVRTDEGKLFTKKDDGSVAEISGGGGIDDGDKGDITVSNSGATFTIDSGVITNAKVSGSAAIAGSKIDPSFTSDLSITTGANTSLKLFDSSGEPDSYGFFGYNNGSDADDTLIIGVDGGNQQGNSHIRFYVDGTSSSAEKFRVDSAGVNVTGNIVATGGLTVDTSTLKVDSSNNRVGIGNSSPDTNLHLTGDTPKFRIESTNSLQASAGTEEIGRIEFEGTKGSNINVAASMRVRQDGTWSTSDDFFSPTAIEFYTQDQSGTEVTTPRLTLDSNGHLKHPDNKMAKFGDSEDLLIYHNGSDSYVQDNGTGKLVLTTNGVSINLYDSANSATLAKFITGGAVELYHSGTKRFETTAGGATVTGVLNLTSHLDMNDNDKILLGDGDDLEIYHNGSTSYITDNGTGSLVINSVDGNIHLRVNNNEEGLKVTENGDVELYHDNTKKFETTSYGAEFSGDAGIARTAGGYTFREVAGGNERAGIKSNSSNDLIINVGGAAEAARFTQSSGATFLSSLTIGDGSAQTELLIKKADNNVSDHLQFYNGTTRMGEIGCEDTTWLRINQETAKNIYTPRIIRADGGFQVDGSTVINGTGSYVRNLSGASDYSSLLRSDTADTMTGNLTMDGNVILATGHVVQHHNTPSRDKYRVWNSSTYVIGMDNAMSFGGLNDYAMTFQMNSDSDRGFVFLDSSHTDSQGAMSLTTEGKMCVAHSLRIGYGESDTTTPGATYRLDVSGDVQADMVSITNGILEVKAEIAASHTLTSGYNAMAVDPTVNSGVTVTVPSGAVWAIV